MKKNERIFRNGILNENRRLIVEKIVIMIAKNKGRYSLNTDEVI